MKSIDRQILRLAVPSIIANVTTPLLSLVDTAVTGHLGSAVFLAAIAVGGTIFNMLYWLFGFLRSGTGGMTAQAYGASDSGEYADILRRSVLIAFGIGVVIILLQMPAIEIALRLMDVPDDTVEFVRLYFGITVYGAPAVLGSYALCGWFIGMQNTRYPMWSSIVVNVVNISVSLVAVYMLHLGLKGVALGTVTAQWCGVVMLLLLTRRYRIHLFSGVSIRRLFNMVALRRFFNVNSDIFLRTLCLIAVTVWFTRQGAEQGVTMLAVNTLLMQFFIITSYVTDGFAFAAEALTGRFVGERNSHELKLTIRHSMLWGTGIAMVFSMLFLAGGDGFMNLLSDDAEVITAARPFRYWTMLLPLAGFAAFIWDGVFIGATRTRALLVSMGVAMVWFFGMVHLLLPHLGNNALWFAFVSYLAVRGLVLTVVYRISKFIK